MAPDRVRLESKIGVVTGIEGGLHKRDKEVAEEYSSIDVGGDEGGGGEGTGIMTTVRIGRTYV